MVWISLESWQSELEKRLLLSASSSEVARVSGDKLLGDAFYELGALSYELPLVKAYRSKGSEKELEIELDFCEF